MFGLQGMLAGPQDLITHGEVRNVSLVEYRGKKVVVKTLIPQEQTSHQTMYLERHRREVLVLDAVSAN